MPTEEDTRASAEGSMKGRTELPAGWRGGRIGDNRATYAYGSHIEVEIEPRYLTKRAQQRRKPSQFRAHLRKRFYAHQLVGDATLLGTTDSFDAAEELAYDYMAEFVKDRHEVAMETREELEADPLMAQEAEEAIIIEAATEAAIEVAGYSDNLLVNDLCGLLEIGEEETTVLQAVVHRDGTKYDVVYVAEGYEEWTTDDKLREFYREFDWLNEQKLSSTLAVGELTLLIGTFEETRMVRCLASEEKETLFLLDPDYPLHIPPFERQVADIVSAKWNGLV